MREQQRLLLPHPAFKDLIAEKIRGWAKKINKDGDIRRLQQTLAGADSNGTGKTRKARRQRAQTGTQALQE